MGVVSQIRIKMQGTAESSKQTGGTLLIQKSLCFMEPKTTRASSCVQKQRSSTYIKLNQVHERMPHSLTIRVGQ